MDPAPRGPGWGLEAEAQRPRQAGNRPECQSLLCVALGGAARSCFGSLLVSWADTSKLLFGKVWGGSVNGLHISLPDRAFVQSCLLFVPCEVSVPGRVEYFVGTMGLKPVRTLPPAHQPCRGAGGGGASEHFN